MTNGPLTQLLQQKVNFFSCDKFPLSLSCRHEINSRFKQERNISKGSIKIKNISAELNFLQREEYKFLLIVTHKERTSVDGILLH